MAAPWRRLIVPFCLAVLVLAGTTPALAAGSSAPAPAPESAGLTSAQRAGLLAIARDTWPFYARDVDPDTHLPLDNLGPGTTRGAYTSAANVGVYLWAVVSAADLGLISRPAATELAAATLGTVSRMRRDHGLLYQWYDTSTAQVISNPGAAACDPYAPPAQDNCSFLSAVDNGWYASGLVVVRQALPSLRRSVDALMAPMDFSVFYDARPQTACNVNASLGGAPTGQQYGGYYVDQGPAGYHNGAVYSDPRISMYIGMGLGQMPATSGGAPGALCRRGGAPRTRATPRRVSGRRRVIGRATGIPYRQGCSACGRATTPIPART